VLAATDQLSVSGGRTPHGVQRAAASGSPHNDRQSRSASHATGGVPAAVSVRQSAGSRDTNADRPLSGDRVARGPARDSDASGAPLCARAASCKTTVQRSDEASTASARVAPSPPTP